jgi:O-antigen/teichoic acid export membrane protein
MSLRRILRMLASFFMGQGVSIISQLLVPPFFLIRYPAGVEVYGEWLALSAAVTYIGTLNYGIQTYANNQSAIYYNRGEVEAAKTLQASAFRLLLLIIGVLSLAGASVFVLPVGRWLNLHHVSSQAASLTLYLLILQVLFNMLFALFANSYMMIGKMHRGANWLILQRLVGTFAIAASAWFRAPFPVLAFVLLASVVVFAVLVLVDLRRTAPILVPSFRYGRWGNIRPILKPSAHFGLLSLSGFLTYQGPVLLIQTMLGPAAVTVFSLARTVFSMGRQALAILSFSIGQEITLLIGQRNWPALKRLYDLSERVVLLLVPICSVGVLLLSPFLFAVWLHSRNLYDPELCFIMAVISAVMGIKEHKYQFQSSSNEHERLSRFTLGAYAMMLLVAFVLMRPLGILGLMLAWLGAEVAQTIYILRLNVQLFPADVTISMVPVVRLLAVLTVAFGLAAWPVFASVEWPLAIVVGTAVLLMLTISIGSYFAFGLDEVRFLLVSKIRHRMSPRPQS